jgi:adenylate cyclase class IV
MNKEIERAYIARDIDGVRSGIARAGFTLARKEEQVNVYYDHAFLDLIENKKYLRVRWTDGWSRAEISFSSPRMANGIETRPQHVINNKTRRGVERVIAMLEGIGFYEALVMEKERELFTIDGRPPVTGDIHVELDTGITIHPREIGNIRRAKHHDVRIEDTVQICAEFNSDGSIITGTGMNRINIDALIWNNIAMAIGLKDDAMTTKNYFDRYFEA